MRFGIVTPSLNQHEFLALTIESVLAQESLQDNIEVKYVVMDGGSTDGSELIINEYTDLLHHYELGPDNGQADAIVRGFNKIDADVFAYLNSDDIYLPHVFKKVKRIFENDPTLDFIYSNRIYIDENNSVIGCWKLPTFSSYFLSRWSFVPQETLFWRSQIHERVGPINVALQFCMDYEFLIRLIRNGKGKRINDYFSAFRMHSKSKTARLYYTYGLSEVAKVRLLHNINANRCIGRIYELYVKTVSWLFWQLKGKSLQGLLDNFEAKTKS